MTALLRPLVCSGPSISKVPGVVVLKTTQLNIEMPLMTFKCKENKVQNSKTFQ